MFNNFFSPKKKILQRDTINALVVSSPHQRSHCQTACNGTNLMHYLFSVNLTFMVPHILVIYMFEWNSKYMYMVLHVLFIPLYYFVLHVSGVGPVAQSVLWLATGWTVRGSNPGGGEIFRTCPDRPWGPPSLLYNGFRDFPGGKAAGAWRWHLNNF
jgi:hypothetical protein